MTFDDVRAIALKWPEVTDGTSYGTPALKVRGKLLTRLKEDGESLVLHAGHWGLNDWQFGIKQRSDGMHAQAPSARPRMLRRCPLPTEAV